MTDTTAPSTSATPNEDHGAAGIGREEGDPTIAGEPAPTPNSAENVLFGGRLGYGTGWATHEGAQMAVSGWTIARRLPQQVARAGRLGWAADRRALVTVLGCQVSQGVAGALGLLATNSVLTGLLAGPADAARLRAVLPALAGVAAAGVAGSVLSAAATAATGRLEPAVERHANVTLLEHAVRVELAAIEDASFQNLLQSAQFGAYAARRMVNHAAGLLTALIGLIAAAGVLGVLHPLLLPLLVLITVPKGWAAVRSNRRQYASTKAFLEHHRQQSVVADRLVDDQSAEEVRVHDAGRFLLDHYRQLAAAGEAEQARLARAEARTTLAGDALAGVATVATYGLLGGLLVAGAVPLAAAGTAVLAIRTGTGNLANLVAEINAVYEQALYVADLDEACRSAEARAIPTGGAAAAADPEVVAAHDLSFTYPGATKPALDGVDVELRRGQVVALVGENGSGKTTLSRLIAGLYEPTSGTLTWDGIDMRTLDRASVFTRVALISQDFTRWPFTARVNITIGRPDQAHDEQRLRSAAARTDADTVVAGLPRGWNTLLARYFAGGVNLSGGQWQRVALGRGIFRSGALVICDEPTASLDPRAEIEAFDKIRQLAAEGHTVVLITHRLASVRHADHIYVLHLGRIAEHGTHEELLAANGSYAGLFALQANQYGAPTTP